jgi:hypothetical protein
MTLLGKPSGLTSLAKHNFLLCSVVTILTKRDRRRRPSEELQYIRSMQLAKSRCCAAYLCSVGKDARRWIGEQRGCTACWNVTSPCTLAIPSPVDQRGTIEKHLLSGGLKKQCVAGSTERQVERQAHDV